LRTDSLAYAKKVEQKKLATLFSCFTRRRYKIDIDFPGHRRPLTTESNQNLNTNFETLDKNDAFNSGQGPIVSH